MKTKPELSEFLRSPDIKDHIRTVRKNIGLATIIGEPHTTQPFQTAEELSAAFRGQLLSVNRDVVDSQVAEAKQKYMELIEDCGIKEDDLKILFEKVWIYSRLTNPTNELLEEVISQIEKTEQTAVFASGLAAISATVQQFTPHAEMSESGEYKKGGKIVVIGAIYGGTYAQMMHSFEQTGRQFQHLPISQFVTDGLPDDTDMVFFEACNNPTLRVSPINQIVKEAKRVNALTVCDNTFTPMSICSSQLGVDLAVHSMTKYFGGRSEDLGGSVSGKKELISQFLDLHAGERMVKGAVLSPRSAKQYLGNLEDLPERLYIASENARLVQAAADKHSLPARMIEDDVSYEGLRNPDMPSYVSNGMVTIDFGSSEKARSFVNSMVKKGVGKCAVSLGAKTTYYCIPAETTHSEMPQEEQKKAGITPGLVRISCGTEEDLAEKFEEVLAM